MYGELDCDILLTQTNGVTTYLYVHDGIVVYESRITDLGDGRTVSEERMLITDTSLDGTDVTGGRTNLGYVEAGSWFDYNIYINDSPFDSISYDVVSVDGDDAMVSVDGDEPVQMTVYQLRRRRRARSDDRLSAPERVSRGRRAPAHRTVRSRDHVGQHRL